jgi:Tripartite tricarboxylate transporter TctA family
MCAVYYGAMFGGSRSSIMINIPGDASAIVSCFDGYPMTKNGRAETDFPDPSDHGRHIPALCPEKTQENN